jgi:ribonuclease P protein component
MGESARAAQFGFGADRRLRRHVEFVRAQRTGRRVGTAHFTLLVAPQPRGSDGDAPASPRLGIVAARKIGGAVVRNRVKRLCRECFRLWPDLLPLGVDLVVIARPGAHELGLAGVRAEWRGVEALLKKRAREALAHSGPPHHPAGAKT